MTYRHKTIARYRREQLGVQLRVEPDVELWLPLETRACGGCGYHRCSCPPASPMALHKFRAGVYGGTACGSGKTWTGCDGYAPNDAEVTCPACLQRWVVP
jgi:hypothetical protein